MVDRIKTCELPTRTSLPKLNRDQFLSTSKTMNKSVNEQVPTTIGLEDTPSIQGMHSMHMQSHLLLSEALIFPFTCAATIVAEDDERPLSPSRPFGHSIESRCGTPKPSYDAITVHYQERNHAGQTPSRRAADSTRITLHPVSLSCCVSDRRGRHNKYLKARR